LLPPIPLQLLQLPAAMPGKLALNSLIHGFYHPDRRLLSKDGNILPIFLGN